MNLRDGEFQQAAAHTNEQYRNGAFVTYQVRIPTSGYDFLKDQNIQNLDLIYWGFDGTTFEFSKESILGFKKKYNLVDKPIIYLGNCQEEKGVVEMSNLKVKNQKS